MTTAAATTVPDTTPPVTTTPAPATTTATPTDLLPATGGESLPIVLLAVGLLLLGGGTVLATRRS